MASAKVISDVITVIPYHIEGKVILETQCNDFDAFIRLPRVVDYNGTICTITGFNSDTGRACYKSGMPYARVVR